MHAKAISSHATPFVVGLTGGIGCGKSTVAEYFAQRNVGVIDADVIAHALTASGGVAIGQIRSAFGDTVISVDGSLNRATMRNRVFNAPLERLRLEAILHPAIRDEIDRQIQIHRVNTASPCPYLLLIAPLLFESLAYRQIVMRTVAIDCPQSMQIARVMGRSMNNLSTGVMSSDDVSLVIATQIPRAVRLQLADDVILNYKSVEHLESAVDQLHQRYLASASARASIKLPAKNEAYL